MSDAKKCDRCGKLYEIDANQPDYTMSIKRFDAHHEWIFDLCDDCMKIFNDSFIKLELPPTIW